MYTPNTVPEADFEIELSLKISLREDIFKESKQSL
jgi:hypothetical protein